MKYLLMVLLLSASLFAQSDSMILVKKSSLPASVVKQIEVQQNFETLGKFAGMGKEVGTAIREGLGALNDESNRFADTDVGRFVMFIIAFKVLGYVVIQFIVGVPLLAFGTLIFAIYFMKACIPRRVVKTTTGTGKDKVIEYETLEPEHDWLGLAAAGCYAAYILICVAIIFIHG